MPAITKQTSCYRITPIYRKLQVLKINDFNKLETAHFMHQFSTKSQPASSSNSVFDFIVHKNFLYNNIYSFAQ